MLHFATPLPPAIPFASGDLDEFLNEAVALAERINRRLGERTTVPSNDGTVASSEPVEN